MSLPLYQPFSLQNFSQLQTTWSSQINPVLSIPFVNGLQLKNITLVANTPLTINHLLSRMQQGWFITDINAEAQIWRTQPFNALTLTLESSADVTINIWVF